MQYTEIKEVFRDLLELGNHITDYDSKVIKSFGANTDMGEDIDYLLKDTPHEALSLLRSVFNKRPVFETLFCEEALDYLLDVVDFELVMVSLFNVVVKN